MMRKENQQKKHMDDEEEGKPATNPHTADDEEGKPAKEPHTADDEEGKPTKKPHMDDEGDSHEAHAKTHTWMMMRGKPPQAQSHTWMMRRTAYATSYHTFHKLPRLSSMRQGNH